MKEGLIGIKTREIEAFAWFPTKLNNDKLIWLAPYIEKQEFQKVWEFTRDLGYPDKGEYGWVDKWVTVEKL